MKGTINYKRKIQFKKFKNQNNRVAGLLNSYATNGGLNLITFFNLKFKTFINYVFICYIFGISTLKNNYVMLNSSHMVN